MVLVLLMALRLKSIGRWRRSGKVICNRISFVDGRIPENSLPHPTPSFLFCFLYILLSHLLAKVEAVENQSYWCSLNTCRKSASEKLTLNQVFPTLENHCYYDHLLYYLKIYTGMFAKQNHGCILFIANIIFPTFFILSNLMFSEEIIIIMLY